MYYVYERCIGRVLHWESLGSSSAQQSNIVFLCAKKHHALRMKLCIQLSTARLAVVSSAMVHKILEASILSVFCGNSYSLGVCTKHLQSTCLSYTDEHVTTHFPHRKLLYQELASSGSPRCLARHVDSPRKRL